ncbi:MAG: DPP IV N-terminal domain-containing protein [Bacteroides cellulosilyticus]
MALTEFTRETINASDMSFQEFKFSKDQKTFTFERKGRTYEYNRLTRHLKELPLKTDEQKEEDVVYSWMNFSPDKKYILYAKNHNLYVRGNKAMGIDTTEVQLTFDGVENYTYARTNDGYRPNEEMPVKACWCKDSRHAYVVLEDERKLRDFWVINSLSEHPELEKYKYEFPGDKYVTQHDPGDCGCEREKGWKGRYRQMTGSICDGV